MIYAAIAVAWLAYLIPNYLRRRDEVPQTDDETDVNDRFSRSVRVIRPESAPHRNDPQEKVPERADGHGTSGDCETSGDSEPSARLTRRESIAELGRLQRHAAARRRRVLIGLLVILTGVVAIAGAGLASWWSVVIPVGMVAGFCAISRHSVTRMRRDFGERYAELNSDDDGESMVTSLEEQPPDGSDNSGDATPNQSQKPAKSAALWDPLPITTPTYVSKPLAPRTVRTIDLSAPELSPPQPSVFPVTAERRPAAELVPTPDKVVEVANPEAAKPSTSSADRGDQAASETEADVRQRTAS